MTLTLPVVCEPLLRTTSVRPLVSARASASESAPSALASEDAEASWRVESLTASTVALRPLSFAWLLSVVWVSP